MFLIFSNSRLSSKEASQSEEHRFRMCDWAPRWTACVTHGHRRATQTRRVRGTWSGPNRLRLGRRRCVASTRRADVLLHKSLVRSIIATTVLFVDLVMPSCVVYSYSCVLVYWCTRTRTVVFCLFFSSVSYFDDIFFVSLKNNCAACNRFMRNQLLFPRRSIESTEASKQTPKYKAVRSYRS